MKERLLKSRARDYFQERGYQVWMPPRVKWLLQQDVFSVWDGIAWKEDKFIFFQITTVKNKSTRLKKITNYMLSNHLYFSKPVEGWIMAWRARKRRFEITKI